VELLSNNYYKLL